MIQHFSQNGRVGFVHPEIDDYAAAMSAPETELRKKLAAETRKKFPNDAVMMIGPQEAAALQVLLLITNPRVVFEIGTFTGYSGLTIHEVLPRGGKLVTFEAKQEHAKVAARYFAAAQRNGGAEIELIVGNAHVELARMMKSNPPLFPDVAFIDAEKTGYRNYFERCKNLISSGGLIIADNTLSCKRKGADDPDGKAIAEFNEYIRKDSDVHVALTTIRDGMTIAYVK